MSSKQTIAALIEHEGFVRSLARSLVPDRALAEDLAQDTWVAALRNPPAASRSPRGWLTSVMRNQLRNFRRGDVRRSTREALAARPERVGASEGLSEQLELQQRVVEAVLSLPESQREVLLMRYYEGLSAAEIARRKDVPAATVRSRLKRALETVRTRLDREHPGGRASWCALLVGMRRSDAPPPAMPAGLVAGAVGLCAALAVTLVLLGVGALGDPDPSPPSSSGAAASLEALRGAAAAPAQGVGVVPDVRQEHERVPAAPPERRVVARLADDGGRPVAGAEVWMFQCVRDSQGKSRYEQSGPFVSASDGRVEGPPARYTKGSRFDRFVHACIDGQLMGVGRSLRSEQSAQPEPEIAVLMVPTRRVHGTVTVPEGYDVTAVRVRVHSLDTTGELHMVGGTFPRSAAFAGLDSALPERFEDRVDGLGRFELSDVPVGGRIYLMAEAVGLGQGQYANVGQGYVPIPDSVSIALHAEGILVGAVHDDAGQPLAGASVSLSAEEVPDTWVHESIRTSTDETGAFHIEGLAAGSYSLSASTADRRWTVRPRQVGIEAGATREVGVDMVAPVRVAGRVLDADSGEPVAGARVAAIEPREFGHNPTLDGDVSDDSGAFELWVPPGSVALYFSYKPSAYECPEPQIVERFTASSTAEGLETLLLRLEPVVD